MNEQITQLEEQLVRLTDEETRARLNYRDAGFQYNNATSNRERTAALLAKLKAGVE
jgi:hypothetical protein